MAKEGNSYSLLKREPSGTGYFTLAFTLWKLLKNIKPDVIITNTMLCNIIGHFVARLCGIGVRIAVQHTPLYTYPRHVRLIDRFFCKAGFYSANIAVTAAALGDMSLNESYLKKTRIIYHGIEQWKTDKSRETVRSDWGLPLDKFIIVNVGRLHSSKNQVALLETAARLPENCMLIIIGEGELKESLRKKAAGLNITGRVLLTGELKWHDVMLLLKASDLFLFPSLYESMGLAMVEAMQLGVPVVASDIPALREVAGNAAVFVKPDDPASLARAVQKIKEDKALAARLGRLGRERAARFTMQQMVDSYEKLFCEKN